MVYKVKSKKINNESNTESINTNTNLDKTNNFDDKQV